MIKKESAMLIFKKQSIGKKTGLVSDALMQLTTFWIVAKQDECYL